MKECEGCRLLREDLHRLKEEVYILSSEIVAVKQQLEDIKRNMPHPEQLGEAAEAARLLRRIRILGR